MWTKLIPSLLKNYVKTLSYVYNLWLINDIYKQHQEVFNELMEKPRHLHEIVRPLREIVRGVGEFVVNKVVPSVALDNLFSPPEARGANVMLGKGLGYDKNVLAYDSEGNWHNPEPLGE